MGNKFSIGINKDLYKVNQKAAKLNLAKLYESGEGT